MKSAMTPPAGCLFSHRELARVLCLCVSGAMFLACVGASSVAANHSQVPDKTVIVIRDFRLMSADEFAAQARMEDNDLTDEEVERQYARHLATVRQIQREQYSVARRALQETGSKTIFIEYMAPNDIDKFTEGATAWAERASDVDEVRRQAISLQRSLELRRQNGETDGDFEEKQQQLAELREEVIAFGMDELRNGVTARLLATDDLAVNIKTVDTKESLQLLHPSADGEASPADNLAEREKLLAKQVSAWLEKNDVAILLLSGDVDLRDDLRELELEVQYGVATVPSFPK